MKNKIKDQTIIAAEIVIVILIIMMLMLPQLIGTVSVGRTKGAWKNFDDLNGKIIGIVDGSGTREFSDSIWDQYGYSSDPSLTHNPND
jgi:hypothetical protein